MFCPNDKAMLRPIKGAMTCPKCGYSKEGGQSLVVKGKAVEKETVMVDSADRMDVLPTTDEYKCEKCGNGKAFYFMRQTRSADEATTRFLECTACGFKWREYR